VIADRYIQLVCVQRWYSNAVWRSNSIGQCSIFMLRNVVAYGYRAVTSPIWLEEPNVSL